MVTCENMPMSHRSRATLFDARKRGVYAVYARARTPRTAGKNKQVPRSGLFVSGFSHTLRVHLALCRLVVQ